MPLPFFKENASESSRRDETVQHVQISESNIRKTLATKEERCKD